MIEQLLMLNILIQLNLSETNKMSDYNSSETRVKPFYGSYSRHCIKCNELKHIAKYKRYNSHHKICNQCFLDKNIKENNEI